MEDSFNGIRSAAAARMLVVAVPNTRFPPDGEALALADGAVDTLAELTPNLVRRLAAERG